MLPRVRLSSLYPHHAIGNRSMVHQNASTEHACTISFGHGILHHCDGLWFRFNGANARKPFNNGIASFQTTQGLALLRRVGLLSLPPHHIFGNRDMVHQNASTEHMCMNSLVHGILHHGDGCWFSSNGADAGKPFKNGNASLQTIQGLALFRRVLLLSFPPHHTLGNRMYMISLVHGVLHHSFGFWFCFNGADAR